MVISWGLGIWEVRRKCSHTLIQLPAQEPERPQSRSGIIELLVALLHFRLGIAMRHSVGILRHGVIGQRLHALRIDGIGIAVFGLNRYRSRKGIIAPVDTYTLGYPGEHPFPLITHEMVGFTGVGVNHKKVVNAALMIVANCH
jgi:hypothetical protein